MQETCVQSLGLEDTLEEEMATQCSILAWKTSGTEKSGGPWGCKKLDTTEWLSTIVDLEYFTFCCTPKWFSYMYIFIYIYIFFLIFFNIMVKHLILRYYSSLCYIVGPCCLSVLCIIVCICSSRTPNPSLPQRPLRWQPQVCFLCLWLSNKLSWALFSWELIHLSFPQIFGRLLGGVRLWRVHTLWEASVSKQ